MSQPPAEEYSRSLSSRHINMIALGGAIGVGLFLGSGKALHQVGSGLIAIYAIAALSLDLQGPPDWASRLDDYLCGGVRL